MRRSGSILCLALASAASALLPSDHAVAAQAAAVKPAPTPFVQSEAREVVAKLAEALEANFVFPEVGKQYAAMLRTKLAAGEYDSFATAREFSDAVTRDLQAVHKDGHLRLFAPSGGSGGPRIMAGAPSEKSTVLASGMLAPNVAYISFEEFTGNDATMADVRAFLDKAKGADTLIIDARKHRGGGLDEMDLIFPQLFAAPATLVEMDTRTAVEERGGNPFSGVATVSRVPGPESVVRQRHSVTPAANPTLAKAKVYLLTSKRSASAAEHLALALKRTHRATLVGETTRGAGNYGNATPLGHGYMAFIPVGRTFDPDTGQGWEGTGVAPDVVVPEDQALDKALELAGVKADAKVALAGLK